MLDAYTTYYTDTKELSHVKILSYDRNKYCAALCADNTVEEIKTGYLFRDAAGTKHLGNWLYRLPHHRDEAKPTRKQYAEELRRNRKIKRHYTVWNSKKKKAFTTKAEALTYFASLWYAGATDVILNVQVHHKFSSSSGPIAEIEGNEWFRYKQRGPNIGKLTTRLRKRHGLWGPQTRKSK